MTRPLSAFAPASSAPRPPVNRTRPAANVYPDRDGDNPRWLCAGLTAVPLLVAAGLLAVAEPPAPSPRPAAVQSAFDPEMTVVASITPGPPP